MIYIHVDRESGTSLTKQIYSSLKDGILSGALIQGEKLPSSRELAKQLHVARNIAIESYEQLIAEGYVYAKRGSGTYVCEAVKLETASAKQALVQNENPNRQTAVVSFRTGVPDLNTIPVQKWAKTYKEIAISVAPTQLDYQSSLGEFELRYQLSLYLRRARGVDAAPENILITNGAAQSFSLLSRLVPDDGYALVENPLSYGIRHTLESNNITVRAIELDSCGMRTSQLPVIPPHLIFTTPSHQFPTGVVLPAKRRIELVQYARNHDAYIVEDDYDSEFRFDGSPIQSMQQLDPERVIYVGTFSKTLMPALRMGYMVLPSRLRAQMEEAKFVADLHSPALEQLAMAKFIEEGQFDRHIRRMRKIYLSRRNFLIKCLHDTFGEMVCVSGADAGMHLIATFHGIRFDEPLMQKIKDAGVEISAVVKHCLPSVSSTAYGESLIFGYGNTESASIDAGIKLLYAVLAGKKFVD